MILQEAVLDLLLIMEVLQHGFQELVGNLYLQMLMTGLKHLD